MSAQLVELQLDRASARDANSERKSERLAVQPSLLLAQR
jgi:hypothetical protein